MSHTVEVDRLLIRTAAGQAGIGNNDGHIAAKCINRRRPSKSENGSRRRHRHQPSPIPRTGPRDTHSPETTLTTDGEECPRRR